MMLKFLRERIDSRRKRFVNCTCTVDSINCTCQSTVTNLTKYYAVMILCKVILYYAFIIYVYLFSDNFKFDCFLFFIFTATV